MPSNWNVAPAKFKTFFHYEPNQDLFCWGLWEPSGAETEDWKRGEGGSAQPHLRPHLLHHLRRLCLHPCRGRHGQLGVLQRGGGGDRGDNCLSREASGKVGGEKVEPWWQHLLAEETAQPQPCSQPRAQPHSYWIRDPVCGQRLIERILFGKFNKVSFERALTF